MSDSPWTFGETVEHINLAKASQAGAEAALRDAWQDYASKEQSYRVALAKRITELRAEGIAATTCGDLARGDEKVSALKFARDVAEGVREAAQSALWRHTGNRRDATGLAEWSMRRELAENGGQASETTSVIGGRRAA